MLVFKSNDCKEDLILRTNLTFKVILTVWYHPFTSLRLTLVDADSEQKPILRV